MKWKKYVQRKNAETYIIPPPWESRDKVAAELDCAPEKVDENLRPGLRSGEIQKQPFMVWDERLNRKVLTIAYCHSQELNKDGSTETPIEEMKKMKQEGKTYAEIGAVIGISGDAVRAKLRRG